MIRWGKKWQPLLVKHPLPSTPPPPSQTPPIVRGRVGMWGHLPSNRPASKVIRAFSVADGTKLIHQRVVLGKGYNTGQRPLPIRQAESFFDWWNILKCFWLVRNTFRKCEIWGGVSLALLLPVLLRQLNPRIESPPPCGKMKWILSLILPHPGNWGKRKRKGNKKLVLKLIFIKKLEKNIVCLRSNHIYWLWVGEESTGWVQVYKLELGKKMVGGNKKKRVKKVEVGGLAIILTGTESHSNLNVAKHCRTRLGFLVSQHYISNYPT